MGQCKANEAVEGPREGECGLLESAHACSRTCTHTCTGVWLASDAWAPTPTLLTSAIDWMHCKSRSLRVGRECAAQRKNGLQRIRACHGGDQRYAGVARVGVAGLASDVAVRCSCDQGGQGRHRAQEGPDRTRALHRCRAGHRQEVLVSSVAAATAAMRTILRRLHPSRRPTLFGAATWCTQ